MVLDSWKLIKRQQASATVLFGSWFTSYSQGENLRWSPWRALPLWLSTKTAGELSEAAHIPEYNGDFSNNYCLICWSIFRIYRWLTYWSAMWMLYNLVILLWSAPIVRRNLVEALQLVALVAGGKTRLQRTCSHWLRLGMAIVVSCRQSFRVSQLMMSGVAFPSFFHVWRLRTRRCVKQVFMDHSVPPGHCNSSHFTGTSSILGTPLLDTIQHTGYVHVESKETTSCLSKRPSRSLEPGLVAPFLRSAGPRVPTLC